MATAEALLSHDLDALHAFLAGRRVAVLTGAGVSTESGIPDYRDGAGQWKRKQPMTVQEFMGAESAQRRYWARSFVGWPLVRSAEPGRSHRALSQLQRQGRIGGVITQNVDGLHQRAGTEQVLDLHGRLEQVVCMDCGGDTHRDHHQAEMARLNPAWGTADSLVAPDGDADLDPTREVGFRIPACHRCGGVLKPDVVFFGENVPAERVRAAYDVVDDADALLIVGSSLMVFSGYRFARHAAQAGKPLAAINLGRTRADPLLTLRITAPCGEVLSTLARAGA